MIPVYSKEVVSLVEGMQAFLEGTLDSQGLEELLAPVQRAQQTMVARASWMGSPALSDLLRERGLLLEDLLSDVTEAALIEKGRRLQELSYAISSQVPPTPRETPYGLINEILRIAQAVGSGACEPKYLVAKFPDLVRLQKAVAGEGQLFAESYPDRRDLTSRLAAALDEFRQGAGALMEFVESSSADVLQDALKLLKEAAGPMASTLQEMKQHRSSKGYSREPRLDGFATAARAVVSPSGATQGLPPIHLERLAQFLDDLRERVEEQRARRFPRSAWLQEYQGKVMPILEKLAGALAGLSPGERSERKFMEVLKLGKEARRRVEEWENRSDRGPALSAGPLWDDLREAVKGWYYGVVPRPLLQDLIEKCGYQARQSRVGASEAEQTALALAIEALESLRASVLAGRRSDLAEIVERLEESCSQWRPRGEAEVGSLREQLLSAWAQHEQVLGLRPVLLLCRDANAEAAARLALWSERGESNEELDEFAQALDGIFADLTQQLAPLLAVESEVELVVDYEDELENICQILLELDDLQLALAQRTGSP